MVTHFIQEPKITRAPIKIVCVRIDATDSSGQTNSYFGYIEEIWELDYGPLKIPLFRCQWVKLTGKCVYIDEYGMTTVDLKELGYRGEPFVLAKDVTQVFCAGHV